MNSPNGDDANGATSSAIATLIVWLGTAILCGGLVEAARAQASGVQGSRVRMSAPEHDVDRPGFDYRNFRIEGGWQACAEQCAAQPRCWSWTFVKPAAAAGAGHCWLKSVVADATRNACCISGVKEAARAAGGGCDGLVGRWRWFNGATVDCESDGTCTASNGYSGSWRCVESTGRFEIQWSRGGQPAQFVDTLNISPDAAQLSGTNQFGSGVGASRIGAAPAVVQDARPESPAGADQAGILEDRGPPDTFSILFLAVETPRGEAILRQEHWRYYGRREELVFVDGVKVAQAELEPLPAGFTLPQYSPDAFQPGMAFEELARRLSIESFVREEIPDEEGDLAELYWASQLALGFSNGELVYVESMPVNAVGGAR